MSDVTISVSKGVFVFKNGGISKHKRSRRPRTDDEDSSNEFSNKLWYQSYHKIWRTLEKKLKVLNNDMFSSILSNLVETIKHGYNNSVTEIPTATLLTGINMPDHSALFSTLSKEIRKNVTPHVATLYAEDCQNLKYVIENTVNQFVNKSSEDSDTEEFETDDKKPKVRKSNCTFSLLQAWYEKLYGPSEARNFSPVKRKMRDAHKPLVVIFPDFESFSEKVIQDFILIVSSYLNKLPFILVFGVATSVSAVHKSLPYHVSSKISVQIFNSQPSTTYLNNVIENIFFTDDCPFHLGGKVFNLFTDIFLFYDLSVKGFIKNFKFAMLQHFCFGNIMALCTSSRNLRKVLDILNHEDLQKLQELPSVKKFITSPSQEKKSKFSKDEYFKNFIYEKFQEFFSYLNILHLCLKCLHALVYDLPKAPLGKQLRELYSTATSKNITRTSEYEECFKLIGFQSKDELSVKLSKVCKILEKEVDDNKINKIIVQEFLDQLENYVDQIENATTNLEDTDELKSEETQDDLLNGKMDRRQLKQKLLEMSKKSKSMNKYEKTRLELVEYLKKTFEQHLQEPSSRPFYEIFFFNDMSIRKQIIGSHRGAIHSALNDPQHYLQCDCCNLKNETTLLSSMPDISILYKLHLEYGKLINLYDWLQSFLSIVEPDNNMEEDEKRIVKPELQARFTQAVADLEYLGFIKSSKRKIDFVTRLTYGG